MFHVVTSVTGPQLQKLTQTSEPAEGRSLMFGSVFIALKHQTFSKYA